MNQYVTGEMIRHLREAKKLTQSALAEKLNVSDKTVSKWETGRGYPDIALIEPLSGVLGVSVAELFAGDAVVNRNHGFQMRRSVFYACPVCGNVVVSAGETVVCCCGLTLPPLEPESPDGEHTLCIETVEDEYYVTVPHEMSKEHSISFLAAVSDAGVELHKLYPEQSAEARFKIGRTSAIYAFCNRHGFFRTDLHR